jgi:hypothetical protein
MYLINNLPTRQRFLSRNVYYGGFACFVQAAPNDRRFQGLNPKQVKAWIKRERASCETALLRQMTSAFYEARVGQPVDIPRLPARALAPAIVVPMLGVYQLDHPQHMSYACTKHCGFCTLGLHGVSGLRMDSSNFKLRDAVELRKFLSQIETAESIVAGSTLQATRADEDGAKRDLKVMRRRLQKESWKPGLINVKELLRDPQFDFLNVSLSPMHCQKGVYKDVILWTLEAVYECCQNKTHFQRLLRAWDAAAVDQARAYLQGRCKSRGISGVLMASSIEGKIGVRSSSKADLANAMKILRALLFFVHSEAFQALVEEKVEDIL